MLAVDNLAVSFLRYSGWLRRTRLPCLSDVSVTLAAGEVLGVIGASGAGKSLLAHAILGLLPPNAEQGGTITFAGEPLTPLRQARLRGRQIALVPQSIAFLDPLARTRRQVTWAARRAGLARTEAFGAAAGALAAQGLEEPAARAYPHELSGGMARRVLLAIASVGEADLVICDEPTTGLDRKTIARMLAQLRALADQGKAVMVITHDLAAVLPYADKVTVLRDGTAQETVSARAFTGHGDALASPYSRALWRSLPQNDFSAPDGLRAS